MKHSLNLKLGQQLTMTPALQQAIRLLQLSSLEIRQEVQEALDSNLMLEEDAFRDKLVNHMKCLRMGRRHFMVL